MTDDLRVKSGTSQTWAFGRGTITGVEVDSGELGGKAIEDGLPEGRWKE